MNISHSQQAHCHAITVSLSYISSLKNLTSSAFSKIWQKIKAFACHFFIMHDYTIRRHLSVFHAPPSKIPRVITQTNSSVPVGNSKKNTPLDSKKDLASVSQVAKPLAGPFPPPNFKQANMAYMPSGYFKIDNPTHAAILVHGFTEVLTTLFKHKCVTPHQALYTKLVETQITAVSASLDSIQKLKNVIGAYLSGFISDAITDTQDKNGEEWLYTFLMIKDLLRINLNGLKTYCEESIDKNNDAIPADIHVYLKPVINWIFHILKEKKMVAITQGFFPKFLLEDKNFIPSIPVKKIAAFMTHLLVNFTFETIDSYTKPIHALNDQKLTPATTTIAIKEAVDDNINRLSLKVVNRVLSLVTALNVPNLVYDNLEHLRTHFQTALSEDIEEEVPSVSPEALKEYEAKEKKYVAKIGEKLLDIVLPPDVLIDLLKEIQLPTHLKMPFTALLHNYFERLVAGDLDAEQQKTFVCFLNNQLYAGIAFASRKYLKTIVGEQLQKALDSALTPESIRDVLAEDLLPDVIDVLITQMSLKVLFNHLEEFAGLFVDLTENPDMIAVISQKLFPLAVAEGGFSRYSLQKQEITQDKFAKIVRSALVQIRTILKVYKNQHCFGDITTEQVVTRMQEYYHHIYECQNDHIPLLSKTLQTVFQEAKIFEGSGLLFNYTVKPLIEKIGMGNYCMTQLSRLILKAIPPTDEILSLALHGVSKKFTIDVEIEKGKVKVINHALLLNRVASEPATTTKLLKKEVDLLSALLTDFIEKQIKDATGKANIKNLLSGAALCCVNQQTINDTITKLVDRLFSSKEKCKDLLFPALGVLVKHLSQKSD